MKTSTLKTIAWLTLFSISMGMLESAVVIYLREHFYPQGFDFPIQPIDTHISIVELLRELATIIMLLSVGILSGRNKTEKFGWFLFCFAIWDIFYYVFLKLLINWPETLLTWDILFLIPITWTGPVITPVIVSFTMIALAVLIAYFTDLNIPVRFGSLIWTLLITGSVILIVAFCWDYSKFILRIYSFSDIRNIPDSKALLSLSYKYMPQLFNWFLFILGETIIITGIVFFVLKMKKQIQE